MAKLIVLSVILLTIVMPIWLSDRPNPKKSLRLIWIVLVVYAFVWAALCTQCYPKLVFPE
jgi:hypothetical protein